MVTISPATEAQKETRKRERRIDELLFLVRKCDLESHRLHLAQDRERESRKRHVTELANLRVQHAAWKGAQ